MDTPRRISCEICARARNWVGRTRLRMRVACMRNNLATRYVRQLLEGGSKDVKAPDADGHEYAYASGTPVACALTVEGGTHASQAAAPRDTEWRLFHNFQTTRWLVPHTSDIIWSSASYTCHGNAQCFFFLSVCIHLSIFFLAWLDSTLLKMSNAAYMYVVVRGSVFVVFFPS